MFSPGFCHIVEQLCRPECIISILHLLATLRTHTSSPTVRHLPHLMAAAFVHLTQNITGLSTEATFPLKVSVEKTVLQAATGTQSLTWCQHQAAPLKEKYTLKQDLHLISATLHSSDFTSQTNSSDGIKGQICCWFQRESPEPQKTKKPSGLDWAFKLF